MAKVRNFFYIALLPIFGTLLALIIVEVGVRGYEYFLPPGKSWSDRPKVYFKSLESKTYQDYLYSSKQRYGVAGARTFRIAVVGDSFSFAPYMQFTDAFPKVLERMLNINDNRANRVEVVNYGVPAYSTTHEVETVREAVKEGADLVILQFTLNDPEIKPLRPTGITHFNTWGPFVPPNWSKPFFDYFHSARVIASRLHNGQTKQRYINYFIDLYKNPRSFEPFKQAVKKINRITKKRNVPLIGVIFPLFGTPLDSSYPFFECHDTVAKLLDDLQLSYIDLFSTYQGIPLDRLQVIPGGDRHPNEIAHRMAAEEIYNFLATKALIPDFAYIKESSTTRHNIYGDKVH